MQFEHAAPAPADQVPGAHASHVSDAEKEVPASHGEGDLQILTAEPPLGVKVAAGHEVVHVKLSIPNVETEAGMSAPIPKQRMPDILCEASTLRSKRGVQGEISQCSGITQSRTRTRGFYKRQRD